MNFTNETLVASTSPRTELIGETKMTVIVVGITAHTLQTLVATSE